MRAGFYTVVFCLLLSAALSTLLLIWQQYAALIHLHKTQRVLYSARQSEYAVLQHLYRMIVVGALNKEIATCATQHAMTISKELLPNGIVRWMINTPHREHRFLLPKHI